MEKLVDEKHVSVLFCCGAKGRMGVLDLKSYKKENEVVKKEISNNEGVMRSESDDSLRCCSCFSFLFPSGSRFDLFRVFRKKYEEDSQKLDFEEIDFGFTSSGTAAPSSLRLKRPEFKRPVKPITVRK